MVLLKLISNTILILNLNWLHSNPILCCVSDLYQIVHNLDFTWNQEENVQARNKRYYLNSSIILFSLFHCSRRMIFHTLPDNITRLVVYVKTTLKNWAILESIGGQPMYRHWLICYAAGINSLEVQFIICFIIRLRPQALALFLFMLITNKRLKKKKKLSLNLSIKYEK